MSKTFYIGSLILLLGCSKPQEPKPTPPISKRELFRARIARAQAQFEAQLPNQMPPNNSQNATEEQISMVHTSRYHLPPLVPKTLAWELPGATPWTLQNSHAIVQGATNRSHGSNLWFTLATIPATQTNWGPIPTNHPWMEFRVGSALNTSL